MNQYHNFIACMYIDIRTCSLSIAKRGKILLSHVLIHIYTDEDPSMSQGAQWLRGRVLDSRL